MSSNSKKISREEFETLCEKGQIYSGLVDGLGKVFWTTELIYFVKIQELLKPAYYKQVSVYEEYVCRMNKFETVVKTKYNLHIIPPEVLEYTDPIAYSSYYPVPPLKRDAIKDYRPDLQKHFESGKSGLKKDLETATGIEGTIGLPLGIAEELSGSGLLKGINSGLTAISVVNDISDGNYVSATGKTIKAFSGWYGIAWDIGVAIYESERYIIDDYWKARANYNWRRELGGNAKSRLEEINFENALSNLKRAEKRYRELMEKKYGPYWYKYGY